MEVHHDLAQDIPLKIKLKNEFFLAGDISINNSYSSAKPNIHKVKIHV